MTKTLAEQHAERQRAIPCPYCGNDAPLFLSSVAIYGKGNDYGPRYWCQPCKAHVGCHPGTLEPLGSPAQGDLRRARMDAHTAIDAFWKGKGSQNNQRRLRSNAYSWLQQAMQLQPAQCHIGGFTIEQCERVVKLCSERTTGNLASKLAALKPKKE